MYYNINIDPADHDKLAQVHKLVGAFSRTAQNAIANDAKLSASVQALAALQDHEKIAVLNEQLECRADDLGAAANVYADPVSQVISLRMKSVLIGAFSRAVEITELATFMPDELASQELCNIVGKYDGMADSAVVKAIQMRIVQKQEAAEFSKRIL